jgi:SPP1 family predicted phage head-tail adaptor
VNLNGKPTNPGELRTRVLLAPRSVSIETGGFSRPAPDVDNAVSAWAKWVNAHGSEVWTAEASGAESPATVTIRYQAGIDATWFVSKDNGISWFEIVGQPDDIQERHEYLEIKVKRMRSG